MFSALALVRPTRPRFGNCSPAATRALRADAHDFQLSSQPTKGHSLPRCHMLDTKGNRITFFGHSTFSLTTPSGQVALIDPWVMTNPRCPESLKKLVRLDAIFLTHSHTD